MQVPAKDAKSQAEKYQGLLHNSNSCHTIRRHLGRKSTSLHIFPSLHISTFPTWYYGHFWQFSRLLTL